MDKHLVPLIGSEKLGRPTARDVRVVRDALGSAGLNERSVRYVHATLRVDLEDAVRVF